MTILVILCSIHDFTFINAYFKISIFHNSSQIIPYLINPNIITLLTNRAAYSPSFATGLKADLTWAREKAPGEKAIQIIKDGILMPALEGATACQTALILPLQILLCNGNKILLSQAALWGTLPSYSPKTREANATGRSQSGCPTDPQKGCALQTGYGPPAHQLTTDTRTRASPSVRRRGWH